MSISVYCPKCSMELEAPDDLMGHSATCPGCRTQFKVDSSTVQPPKSRQPARQTSSGSAADIPVPPEVSSSPGGDASKESRKSGFFGRRKKRADSSDESGLAGQPAASKSSHAIDAATAAQKKGSFAVFKGLPPEVAEAEVKTAPPAPRSTPPAKPTTPSRASSPATGNSVESAPQPVPVAAQSAATRPKPPSKRSTADSSSSTTGKRATSDSKIRSSREKSRSSTSGRFKSSAESGRRKNKSARLLHEKLTETSIQLGGDGTLPELVVTATESKEKSKTDHEGSNPIILIGVLGFSVCMSLLMLFVEPGGQTASATTRSESISRLTTDYIGEGPELETYQVLLRDAIREENAGNLGKSKRIYRRVLYMLHQEKPNPKQGLTGPVGGRNPPNDDDLEELLGVLLK